MEKDNSSEEPTVQYTRPLDFDQVWKMFQETDKFLSEKFRETDKKIKALADLFTTQWGKLVESLVEGDLIRLLKIRGIKVESVLQRRRGSKEGENYEFDLIAVNGEEIVIVEVKTTLRPQDVRDFQLKLRKAKVFMSEYRERIIYGAVAFITSQGESDRMSEKLGLFMIRATGSSASIVNGEDFKPKQF